MLCQCQLQERDLDRLSLKPTARNMANSTGSFSAPDAHVRPNSTHATSSQMTQVMPAFPAQLEKLNPTVKGKINITSKIEEAIR